MSHKSQTSLDGRQNIVKTPFGTEKSTLLRLVVSFHAKKQTNESTGEKKFPGRKLVTFVTEQKIRGCKPNRKISFTFLMSVADLRIKKFSGC